jgi:hypothetical protein
LCLRSGKCSQLLPQLYLLRWTIPYHPTYENQIVKYGQAVIVLNGRWISRPLRELIVRSHLKNRMVAHLMCRHGVSKRIMR